MFEEFDGSKHARPGALKGYWQDGQTVFFDYERATLSVTVLNAAMARVRLAVGGQFAKTRSWSVVQPDSAYAAVAFTAAQSPDGVTISTDQLLIQVGRVDGQMSFVQRSNNVVICDDGPTGGPVWLLDDSSKVGWRKTMPPDEHYYGFGERTSLLDKRGYRYSNWTTDPWRLGDHGPQSTEMYQAHPYFLTERPGVGSYGLFLNNSYRSTFDMSATHLNRYLVEIEGGEFDYYFIYGPEPAQVVERYTGLVGRMTMPPRWALGYHQCRWSYYPESRIREIADGLRGHRLPADVIHFDIDYMDEYRVFSWDNDRFPRPARLINDLAAQGFKVVTIIDPGVKYQPEGGYNVYDEGHEKGYFMKQADGQEFVGYVWPGQSVFPDFSRADVREWWGKLHQTLLDAGVKGIWNDMNEPAISAKEFGSSDNGNRQNDLDAVLGPSDEPVPYAEIHNLYGYLEDWATSSGLRQLRPNERIFMLTRSGFAGIQKFTAVWSGDNSALWEHLEMSLPQLCNMGLSGMAFVGADIGGFAGNGSPEMFARWMQLGVFYPFMRGHSALGTADKEPWVWGEEVEDICRRAIELRYRLLPYIYTQFYSAMRSGAPILRPLFYQYADDPTTYTLHDQAMFGPSLMVAPVVRPGKTSREVYLPQGEWFDFWADDCISGPKTILAEASLDVIPLYAKGGSVIAFGPVMQYTDERPLDHLTLEVYLDANGQASGVLYEDDGQSYNYEQGDFCLTRFNCTTDADGQTTVTAQRQGKYTPPARSLEIWMHRKDYEVRSHELAQDNGNWQVKF